MTTKTTTKKIDRLRVKLTHLTVEKGEKDQTQTDKDQRFGKTVPKTGQS